MHTHLRQQALRLHQRLPDELWDALHTFGLEDSVIHAKLLGFDGTHLTVPIFNRSRHIAFFEYWLRDGDGFSIDVEKTGSRVELYGQEVILWQPRQVLVAEHSLDRLLLTSKAFNAVSVAGSGGVFRKDWAPYFTRTPEVFIIASGNDEGRRRAESVRGFVSHARVLELPGGHDLQSFFREFSRADFLDLLEETCNKDQDA